ncbi:CU044_2847 family protein [Streptomyces sp. ACA25]|uniref:CU044_2847 family protein n=1 Tax=Streptomyces sp. ACA25 TaxID=3022596 RepID=UPI0023081165|nr:CU044_2847 family protein [Streptomyces sp. ACA25]MDB1088322.1 CU044_2847 family protein [Streptomyces sp. ACA25]
MGELLRFELDNGGSVVAETDRPGPGVVEAAGTADVVARATGSFEAALEGVRSAAASALQKMSDLPQRPDEVSIEFGIQLDAEVGAVLARTGAQGHLQVQLTWHRPSADGEARESDSVQRR